MIRLYTRVSTEEQDDSGLGLDAQEGALLKRYAGEETVLYRDVIGKGKTGADLDRLLAEIQPGDTLAVARLDRLTRNLSCLVQWMERSRKEGWQLVALDIGIDTSTPFGEAMAHMAGVFAQLERRLIGERTKAALAVKKANGELVGRPSETNPVVEARIVEWSQTMSPTMIARRLTSMKVAAPRGGTHWYPSTVRRILERIS